MPTLATTVDGLNLRNPFIIASGPPGTNLGVISRAFREGWGAVIAKTVSLDASKVINVSPRYAKLHAASGEVVGWENIELISDRPLNVWLDEFRRAKDAFPEGVLIASIMEEYSRDAWIELVQRCEAAGVDGFELNFSCPHGLPERRMGSAMGQNPEILEEVSAWVMGAASKPVWAKLTPNITHIEQPHYWETARAGETPAEFGVRAARWLEEKILAIGPDKVAAFIGEPVQGAGGVIIPPETYWPEIQRIVDKYGILLIADEVICAFGRLGHWFAYEKFGMKPDLVTFAKGVTSGYIPLGGVMVGNRVADVLIAKGGEFNHGYTYSGHPVACAVALANLELMEREGLVDRVKNDTGPYLAQRFAELKDHPLVGEAETCGFVAGLVLVKDKVKRTMFDPDLAVGMICRGHCFRNGLIMRAVGDRMIIAPPLVMTRAQIDEMMGLIRLCLDATLDDLRSQGLLG